MPIQSTPPNPWKVSIELFDALESDVRSEDFATAREVLDKYRETIETVRKELAESEEPWKLTVALFDAFDSAVRAEDLAAAREVLDKYREAVDKGRAELAESEDQTAT